MHIELNKFIEEMNQTTSSNEKTNIVFNASKEVRKVLYYTYNNYMQYYITPKLLEKRQDL